MFYPLRLQAPLKDYIWGGTRLKTNFHKETSLEKVAESWELACHKNGQSIIINGPDRGKSLEEYLKAADAASLLGTKMENYPYFPILIKLIDAYDDLSVQVHPDDAYALAHEGEYGKTEMWYIIDAKPGASLIHGLLPGVTKEALKKHIADDTLLEICRRVPVRAGDVFMIEAGTIHAIGRGILLAEIQQNSNTTYRVYDYNRIDKNGQRRPLHIKKALDVIRLTPKNPSAEPTPVRQEGTSGICRIAHSPLFTVYTIKIHDAYHGQTNQDSFQSLLVLAGTLTLRWSLGEEPMCAGTSFFLPASFGPYTIEGNGLLLLTHL